MIGVLFEQEKIFQYGQMARSLGRLSRLSVFTDELADGFRNIAVVEQLFGCADGKIVVLKDATVFQNVFSPGIVGHDAGSCT